MKRGRPASAQDRGVRVYFAMRLKFFRMLWRNSAVLRSVEFSEHAAPWDTFVKANPVALVYFEQFLRVHRYELSEAQCSYAVRRWTAKQKGEL